MSWNSGQVYFWFKLHLKKVDVSHSLLPTKLSSTLQKQTLRVLPVGIPIVPLIGSFLHEKSVFALPASALAAVDDEANQSDEQSEAGDHDRDDHS